MTERKILLPHFDVDMAKATAPRWVHEGQYIDDSRRTVEGIRFDATALPIDGLGFTANAVGVQLVVDLRAPDRNRAEVEWIHIWRTLICPWVVLQANGCEYLVRWMRETIANILAHEVEESITYEGVRVFDPHRPLRAGAAS